MLVKIARPASGLPFRPDGIAATAPSPVAGRVVAVRTRYSVIARASWRVRRISSSLELFSNMKKCGIFVLGRNAFGAQIHELMNAGDSFAVTFRRSVPTFR